MKTETRIVVSLLFFGILVACSSTHKAGLCTCDRKNEAIFGTYFSDSSSLKSWRFMSVGSFEYEISLMERHVLKSATFVKNDGGGVYTEEGKPAKVYSYGEWRRLGDTLYIKLKPSNNREEAYFVRGDSLISINKKNRTIWAK
jgi:hypothetical protein